MSIGFSEKHKRGEKSGSGIYLAVTVLAIGLVPEQEPQQIDFFTDIAGLDRLDKLDGVVGGTAEAVR